MNKELYNIYDDKRDYDLHGFRGPPFFFLASKLAVASFKDAKLMEGLVDDDAATQ